jgi:lincosamide nucleotidyltransferase B/F
VLEQDRLIERVRQLCSDDTRLDAALMYGSFTQGQADVWSDIEFWLFFADDSLADVDPDSWCAAVGHPREPHPGRVPLRSRVRYRRGRRVASSGSTC